MANNTPSRPPRGRDAADRSGVLRNVMEVLSEKGFVKTSIADLRNYAGLGYAALHKAFGTREEILRAAIRFCAETEASLAHEPLRCRRQAEKPFSRCWKRMFGCVGIGPDTW
jgi:AcrR family transcriptional regulator